MKNKTVSLMLMLLAIFAFSSSGKAANDYKVSSPDGKLTMTINVGDKVEITYGGQVMMSYPPQIVAKKIIVLK